MSDEVVIYLPEVRIINRRGQPQVIPLRLRYDPATPYSVWLYLPDENTWEIARDLLRDGVRGVAGYCDVQVMPGRHAAAVDTVLVRLRVLSRDAEDAALLFLPHKIIDAFVSLIYREVPDSVAGKLTHDEIDEDLRQLGRR